MANYKTNTKYIIKLEKYTNSTKSKHTNNVKKNKQQQKLN